MEVTIQQLGEVKFVILAATVVYLVAAFIYTHFKFDFFVPGLKWWERPFTFHPTAIWQKFEDYELSDKIPYAKHAISIDETRKDFQRVEWGIKSSNRPSRDKLENLMFEQVWFAGNHTDIGGGYPENEARLSDITPGIGCLPVPMLFLTA